MRISMHLDMSHEHFENPEKDIEGIIEILGWVISYLEKHKALPKIVQNSTGDSVGKWEFTHTLGEMLGGPPERFM